MPKVLPNCEFKNILKDKGIIFSDKNKPHPVSIYNILTHGTDTRNQEVEAFSSPKPG